MNRIWISMAAAGIGAVIGCVGPNGVNVGNGGSGNGGTGNSTGTGTIGGDSGLPCDVADFLTANCISCHSSPPSGGAPMSLLSYADLTAPSKTDASQSNAQLSIARIKDATSPMPPGVHLAQAQYGAFETWVTSGTPMGSCGMIDGGPPDPVFQGDPTCESGTIAPHINDPEFGTTDPAYMNPGEACIKCHQGEPSFNVAGTVFAWGKVPDRCAPPTDVDLTQATVIVTDKNGVEHKMHANSAGNFHSGFGQVPVPYTARVEYQGKVRAMSAQQTSGDCNACHTATGTQGAPGRVVIPE